MIFAYGAPHTWPQAPSNGSECPRTRKSRHRPNPPKPTQELTGPEVAAAEPPGNLLKHQMWLFMAVKTKDDGLGDPKMMALVTPGDPTPLSNYLELLWQSDHWRACSPLQFIDLTVSPFAEESTNNRASSRTGEDPGAKV